MLVQPMASLTDLALGVVTLYLFWRLPRDADASRYWRAAFAWAAVTALIGALYHGFLVGIRGVSHVSWAVMSCMVVVVMSFLLAASVVQVLGRERAVVFWPLRLAGLLAYVVIAAIGRASITAIMWCESLTMACVIGLWIWAWLRHHPSAQPMLVAIGVSIAAAMFRLIPGAAALVGLDPDSAYHLGQIAGMVLLYYAVTGTGRWVMATRHHTHRAPEVASDAPAGLRPAGGGPEAVHQQVEQATGHGVVIGPGGHREDADEGGGDVFGRDVGAEVARRAAGVEDRGDGRQELGPGPRMGDLT